MSFEQSVILKLRRDYTHDEAVAFLSEINSACKVEIGTLKAELAEAEDHLLYEISARYASDRKLKKAEEELENLKSGLKKDELIHQYKRNAKLALAQRKVFKDDARVWRDKYLSLLARTINDNGQEKQII